MKTASIVAILLITGGSLPAFADDSPEHLDSFNPAKGFKPAQQNLTEIYLQLAGSLEYYGSPVPYFRHVQAEQRRISQNIKNNRHPAEIVPPVLYGRGVFEPRHRRSSEKAKEAKIGRT